MALLSTLVNAILRKGIFAGLVVLILFGLVELVLWVAAPISPYLTYAFDFKNQMSLFGLENTSHFEVDSRELRFREPAEKRERDVRILLIGGEGNYVPLQDAEDTWWGRLAAALERRHANLGVEFVVKAGPAMRPDIGTSLRHSVRWAKTYAEEVSPDLVVVSFGLSEVLDPAPDYQYDPVRIDGLEPLPRAGRLKDKAVRVSQIARRLRRWRSAGSETILQRRALLEQPNHLLKNMGQQKTLYERLPFDVSPPVRGENTDPMLEYLDGLEFFRRMAEEMGAGFLVLAEPTLHDDLSGFAELSRMKRPRWLKRPSVSDPEGAGLRPDPGWIERELNRYYAAAAAWAAKTGVPFIDLNREEVLSKSMENFVDDVMLTQMGSTRVAEEVEPVFDQAIVKFLAK